MPNLNVLPVDRLLFVSAAVVIGRFDCPAEHELFRDSGPTQNNLVVFPRTSVGIQYDGCSTFVSGPDRINFYHQGQKYRRHRIARQPDRCDWFAFELATLEEVRGTIRTCGTSRLFPEQSAPSTPELFLRERALVRAIEEKRLDPFEIEHCALELMAEAMGTPAEARSNIPAGRVRDAIEHAKAIIAEEPERNLRLADIAREVGVSPFHLCRSFAKAAGVSLVEYRNALRLRLSSDAIAESRSLLDVALDHGFASHSHLSRQFKRYFRTTPSALRPAGPARSRH